MSHGDFDVYLDMLSEIGFLPIGEPSSEVSGLDTDRTVLDEFRCLLCGSDRVFDHRRATLVCRTCGDSGTCLSYLAATARRKPCSTYKPSFHWAERIRQFHGDESQIPAADWEAIQLTFFQLYGVREVRDLRGTGYLLDRNNIALVLRALGPRFSGRYLEKWLQIVRRLTGHEPPQLSSEEVLAIENCFIGVVSGYVYTVKQRRKHLPNYNYIFLRFFEMLNRPELYVYFPQLKTPDRIRLQNEYWKGICEFNGWPYIPATTVPLHTRLQRAGVSVAPLPERVTLQLLSSQ